MEKPGILSYLFSAALFLIPGPLQAQANVDPPALESIGPTTPIKLVPPTNTWYGTRGLSQTGSAEALGEGRLIFGFHGSGYRQDAEFPGGPTRDAKIFTGIGSASFGLTPYVDAFASLAGYGSADYISSEASGLGSVGGGLQATFPFAPNAPIRMAAQGAVYQGLSDNPVNSNRADGYNYFETRTGLDFLGRLIQTVTWGEERSAFKLHFNEAVVTSMEDGTEPLMLLATGVQFNNRYAAVGLEANSRTVFEDIAIDQDPLWITPSIQFRSAYNVNASLGGDIRLSQDREGATGRSLEPYRLFGGLAYTFDTQVDERWQARERERMRLMEKSRQEARNRELARQKAEAVDLAMAEAEKAREDSMDMARKASEDSLALLRAQARLETEQSKTSEMEKQLLNTGMLLLEAVYFETGKSAISINSEPYLKLIAKLLTRYPKLQIEVAGHTDNVGSEAYNLGLSQARAEAVKDYLLGQAPELRANLSARGYGESRPKSDNTTADGRQQNRRTQLEVLNKDALLEYQPVGQAPM